MRRGIGRTTWIALAATAGLLAAYLISLMLGTVVVYDPGGQVVSAVLFGNGKTQPMHRAPGGFFVAIPHIEGEIAIRCRDGSSGHGGYVTPHIDERFTVAGACRIETR